MQPTRHPALTMSYDQVHGFTRQKTARKAPVEPSRTNNGFPSATRNAPHVRLAAPEDSEGIRAVYAPYLDTPITFEEAIPPAEEFRARMGGILATYPCLVAESNGVIVGYAYAHRQAEREAYGWNAELSVYLAHEACGFGLGGTLYRALIELVRAQGVKCAYALVTVPNAASERLHEAFGFQLMATQRNAGYTCGSWRDVAWYTLALSEFDADPPPVVPFPHLDPLVVRTAIEKANRELTMRSRSNNAPDTGIPQ